MCMYGGSTPAWVGDRHLATVPQGVAGDRLPWDGAGRGGGGGGLEGHLLLCGVSERIKNDEVPRSHNTDQSLNNHWALPAVGWM